MKTKTLLAMAICAAIGLMSLTAFAANQAVAGPVPATLEGIRARILEHHAPLERLVPVTMTAAVAGLALVPLVLSAGQPGKEILYPVAVVILGGLISSTFLDMAVTPAVFFKFGRKAAEKYIAREQTDPLDAIPAMTGGATKDFPQRPNLDGAATSAATGVAAGVEE